MIRSMTAFASDEMETNGVVIGWELRSVNHRYFDVALKLPENLRFMEPEIRKRLAERLHRGKLDAALYYRKIKSDETAVDVNFSVIRKLHAEVEKVEKLLEKSLSINAFELFKWPGVLREPEIDADELGKCAMQLLRSVLVKMVEMRRGEGKQIARMIEIRCKALRREIDSAGAKLPEIRKANRERLLGKFSGLDVETEPGRLEQELVYLAQKMDVDEELDRLMAHVKETERLLQQADPVGRRLDFLLQEMNREANTLGSKATIIDITRASVEMKVLIEQMREQVQNIE